MRRRLAMVVAALVIGASGMALTVAPASSIGFGPVDAGPSVYRCHATVTVQPGFIYGADFTRLAVGHGSCQRDGDTQGDVPIDLSGTWTRVSGVGVDCPPFKYSFDHVRLYDSYFVNRTQEWRQIRYEDVAQFDAGSLPLPRDAFSVYESPSSSIPESFGVAQSDHDTCDTYTDISAPAFTTTADWTFPVGYPVNGPPPDSLLGLCVRGYGPIPFHQYCTKI